MTRARAKLLEQQVNLFLAQTDVCIDENFILPKSLHVCMIRFDGIASVARGGEGLRQEEPKVMIIHSCAREEREAGARGEKEIIQRSQHFELKMLGADYPAPTPDYPAPPPRVEKLRGGEIPARKGWGGLSAPPARIIRPPGLSGHLGRIIRPPGLRACFGQPDPGSVCIPKI